MARRNANLAGLAALGALGYMATRGGDKDAVKTEAAPARAEPTLEELARGSRDLEEGITPQGLNESGDRYSLEPTPAPARKTAVRPRQVAKPSYSAEEAAYDLSREGRRGTAPTRAASQAPSASQPKAAQSTEENRSRASTGLTLGVPIRPAPGTPSIYARPEAWAEYRKRQAEARAAGMKKGGAVKADVYKDANAALKGAKKRGEKSVTFKMASGGSTSSASKRADGIASRGKTKCKMY